MKIIDAHHHIWRQSDLTWLQGPTQPRIFGPYDAIKRDYPIEEFVEDVSGTGVTQSVYVQTNWPPGGEEDEVAWVQATAERAGWPHAIVGFCDMTVADARPMLERLARYPLMRGIRQQYHWHENPLYRFAAHADMCRDDKVKRNIALLADYNWAFDLQVFAGQIDAACELVDACPKVTFILQHAGMLEDLSDEGRASWKAQMKKLAQRENVVSKLSGLGTFIHRNDPVHVERILHDTVALFGADRCLFGSNFPIEKLWTDYGALVEAFRRAASDLSTAQQKAIFHDTAARVYRL
ncbi:amidohydrolase family protein [Aquibaculum arenosum]|uniref:Amidohydrolase family protein n=1 Tax=Aquibaculum arenosum TaxID=3032591 RepID=A0ABT5YIS2_9PROT|nr:amidohydrolase family protein [Fodinicurvata sp. CAU 1616]MDF2094836.1 amidohydrolase family protein [Fodinicurvata sp. CAU 1616]